MCAQPLRDSCNGVEITTDMVAGTTLGERCWVKWPYLQVRQHPSRVVMSAIGCASRPLHLLPAMLMQCRLLHQIPVSA